MRTNQPISYNVVKVHHNPGAFSSIYFKLEPHLGEWGEEGDFIRVGIDENAPNGWVILPPELPLVELNTAMDINEVISLPNMWPDEEISITQQPPTLVTLRVLAGYFPFKFTKTSYYGEPWKHLRIIKKVRCICVPCLGIN